jgi:hypothetical protein
MTQEYKGKRLPNYLDGDEMDGCTQAMFEAAIPKFSSIPKIGMPVILGSGLAEMIPDEPTIGDGFIPAERYLYNGKTMTKARKAAEDVSRIDLQRLKPNSRTRQIVEYIYEDKHLIEPIIWFDQTWINLASEGMLELYQPYLEMLILEKQLKRPLRNMDLIYLDTIEPFQNAPVDRMIMDSMEGYSDPIPWSTKKKKKNKAKQVRHNWKYGLYLKLQKMHKEGAFKKIK